PQTLHFLVGPDWRLLSRAFLFRGGSIASATLSRGRFAEGESFGIALQRYGEGADAIFHSAAGCACVYVLSIREAAGLFQSAGVRTCGGARLCATVSGVAKTIRRRLHTKTCRHSCSF